MSIARSHFILSGMALALRGGTPIVIQHGRDGSPVTAADLQYSVMITAYDRAGSIIHRDIDHTWPSASIVKLLIAIALLESDGAPAVHGAGVRVDRVAFQSNNRFFAGATVGSNLPAASLLERMIVQSDNFSANVLIAHLGVPRIEKVARRIGLRITSLHGYFRDSSIPVVPRSYTTARECNMMLEYILSCANGTPRTPHAAAYRNLLVMMSRQTDRRFIPSAAGSGVMIADKTGEIHNQINDCAIVSPFSSHPLLFSVLVHGNFDVYRDPWRYDASIQRIRSLIRQLYESAVVKHVGSLRRDH